MDILFNLLKQLSTTVGSGEFLLIIITIIMSIVYVLKVIAKLVMDKDGSLLSIFHDKNKDITDLKNKVEKMVTKDDHDESIAKILSAISLSVEHHNMSTEKILLAADKIILESQDHADSLNNHLTNVLLLKKDLEQSSDLLKKELEDIKHQMKMHDLHDHQSYDNIKELYQKIQDTLQRILSDIEKLDEFSKAVVPEFRSYHKELSKEFGELSRDIALVERSIQTQINTVNSVKLR